MEDLMNRFPSLIPIILENLDNQSLVNFKNTSRDLRDFVESERFYWIRIIEKYKGNFEEFSKCWKKVIERTPREIVKRIALAVKYFFSTCFSNDRKFIFIKRYKQWSPLHIAAASRDPIFLHHVIEKTKFENYKSVTNSLSPLHMAAVEGDLEACELILDNFLERGLSRKFDGYYETPLDYAVTFGHFDVCKFLWDNSGDRNLPQFFYSAYLQISAKQGNFEVFNLFFQAAKNKQLPLNPPDPGLCNRTPLHHAAHDGHLKICKLILEEVEERNPREDLEGNTPLHYAASRGHLEVYKLIADSVQDKTPVNKYGATPFQLAARFGNFAACKFIMNDKGIWQKFNTFFRFIFSYLKSW